MKQRQPFSFKDLEQDCSMERGCHHLDGRDFGVKVFVPAELQNTYPYNSTAYGFLQELRQAIFEFGIIEFPGLPVNPINHTLAQRTPQEHDYSPNPFLTDICQTPHQDTPPLPTGYWLNARRHYFATWIISNEGLEEFQALRERESHLDIEELHKRLVPQSLEQGFGLMRNHEPGLLILDNSRHNQLYHARTCRFEAVAASPDYDSDSPMYAFNEVGLLHYIDSLDIRRGDHDKDDEDLEQVKTFLRQEQGTSASV